ncbi:MAG: XdhC family protein [Planctomycetes bacterium]|nr:XdhC family protein [Planctomycetota bacterium]
MRVKTVLETILREHETGRRTALCSIVATRGSTPQPVGTLVCVDQAARMTGTLGGGCVEADVRRQAHQTLSSGRGKLTTFQLDDDFGYDDGMICGGQMTMAISVIAKPKHVGPIRTALAHLDRGEPASLPLRVETEDGPMAFRIFIESTPKLVIAGGGHIAKVLAQIAMPVGFDVSVVDERIEFANADRFSPPIRPVHGDIASTLRSWPIDANTYVVIVTRGHRNDEAALSAVLASSARYIGMIGSRRKTNVIFNDLRRRGAEDHLLERVHAPIGLDIGAVTAEEIAVSIVAELISVRGSNRGTMVEGPIPIADDLS